MAISKSAKVRDLWNSTTYFSTRTSGQHNPIPSLIRPYSDFPNEISGPTVWKAEDYNHNPERWTHVFSKEQIAELGAAADAFIASGVPLTGMLPTALPRNGQ